MLTRPTVSHPPQTPIYTFTRTKRAHRERHTSSTVFSSDMFKLQNESPSGSAGGLAAREAAAAAAALAMAGTRRGARVIGGSMGPSA
eukprot:1388557-Amorphochlora_amoeboformis.AAC.1